uniref:Uncharacterized protein n=1 Tax=Arundo donax TaxID=35708 RepID=A0A0A9BB13_ARUDO
MHQHKFTFGGKFTAENLYVTEVGKIKVDPSMVSALKPFTDQNSEDDYITAADIIEDIIFAGEKDLPEDICHLIKLMKYESTQFEYVIRCHISSLDSRSQLDHFSWMFKRLDFLELSDPQNYDDIVKKIPYGQGQWKQMVKRSKLLQSIYDYKKRQSTFEDSGKGLVSLGRNSVEHLTKKSVKIVKRKKKVKGQMKKVTVIVKRIPLFEDFQIQHIICDVYSELFGEMQKAFHSEGELTRFNLEETIK